MARGTLLQSRTLKSSGSPLLPSSVANGVSLVVPRIDIAGHSVPAAGGAVGGDQNAFPDRLAKALGVRRRANIAQGGAIACWPTAGASGDGGWSWILNTFRPPASGDGNGGYQPNTSIAIPHLGENDLAVLGSLTPKPFQEALRTILSRYCAAALYEDTDSSWTWGSAMSALTGQTNYSGQNAHYCQWGGSVNAQQFGQWACPADYPGNQVIAIGLAVIPGTVGAGTTATVALTIDGTEYDYTINFDKGGHADAENAKVNGIVLRFGRSDCGLGLSVPNGGLGIPALAAGAHTIKVALKSSNVTGAFFVVDYAQIEADPLDGPLLVVPGSYRAASPTNNGYNLWASYTHGPAAGTDPMNDTSIATWNTAIQAVLADFPNRSVYVDIDSVLAKNAAYLSPSDYTHPTNRGHRLIAQTIHQAIINSGLLTPQLRAGAQHQRFADAYDGGIWRPIGGAFGTTIGVAFSNSWVTFGGSFPAPAYRKTLEGRVQTRGFVKNGTSATAVIAALSNAAGYMPYGNLDRIVPTYTGSVFSNGMLRADTTNGLAMNSGGLTTGSSIEHEWEAVA